MHPTTCLASWNFSVDPCDFHSTSEFVCGIECESSIPKHRRVTHLALDGSGYTGTLSPFIGNLSFLLSLDLSGNAFEGFIPETVGKLNMLVRMDLSYNNFSGIIPQSIGRLSNLTYLSLSNNALQGSISATLNELFNLSELILHNNNLSGSIPPLGALQQLSTLDASNNGLTGQFPSGLPPSLMQLSLRGNRLGGSLPASLSSIPPELMVLDLSNNNMTGTVAASLFQLPALQQLNLSRNQFTAIVVADDVMSNGIESHLVAVDMSYNRISGALPNFFGSMGKLSALSLRYNLFTGAIPLSYASKAKANETNSQPLARLFLDGNYLSGHVPSPFFKTSIHNRISASFILNCLRSCPSNFSFCQGGQRPKSECRRIGS
ncbi:hypothetical protein O6H91_19G075900 [Diphasiastrum complanatum]|nr:hypothetical protein O6H91_19G075900 [Diphasiastrum complanatum]